MAYWANRIDEQCNLLFDNEAFQMKKTLQKEYQRALTQIERDMGRLYDQLIAEAAKDDGVVKPNDLYRYHRYYDLHNTINQRLTALGAKEIKIYDQKLVEMYNKVQDIITKTAPSTMEKALVDEGMAQKVVDSVWCADGRHWSERIWNNKALLQTSLERGLMDCVVRGVPKAELTKELISRFGVSFSQAERITRTELSFIQNQACADRYQRAGVTQYKILEARDDRTCELCEEQDGKVYEFSKMEVGVNYPPFHPNCRGTIIPVLKEG